MHSAWDRARLRGLIEAITAATGLTQRQLAELADVSHSQVSRWKDGSHQPNYASIRRLAARLLAEYPQVAALATELLPAAGYDVAVEAEPRPPQPFDIIGWTFTRMQQRGRTRADREAFSRRMGWNKSNARTAALTTDQARAIGEELGMTALQVMLETGFLTPADVAPAPAQAANAPPGERPGDEGWEKLQRA
jgi:transcriptional regulator with XRE-family HTH domain